MAPAAFGACVEVELMSREEISQECVACLWLFRKLATHVLVPNGDGCRAGKDMQGLRERDGCDEAQADYTVEPPGDGTQHIRHVTADTHGAKQHRKEVCNWRPHLE